MAGSTAKCFDNWAKLTSDQWILQTVKGFVIEFASPPVQYVRPGPLRLNSGEMTVLDGILAEFEAQGIIEKCSVDEWGFYSTLFMRAKRDGSHRVIFNLSRLNEFIDNVHFKMETVKDAIMLTTQNCYFASIDFKNAYYSVPVHVDCRKYLRFMWMDQAFQFTVFPQGLSPVPRAFTKLMKPPFAALREQGLTLIGYIDDTLLISESEQHLEKAVGIATDMFDSLGLTINVKKSVFRPTKRIEYLGFVIDSRSMLITLTERKKAKIRDLALALLSHDTTSIQILAEFIGNLIAAALGVYRAPLHIKGLEISKSSALIRARGNFDSMMSLSESDLSDIRWWADNIHLANCPLTFPEPHHVVTTDASQLVWGAWCGSVSTGGDWSDDEKTEHINWKELKAAYLALLTFCDQMNGCHVRLMMDYTTAIACVHKFGSMKPKLLALTKLIYKWAASRDIHLSAAHIPGKLNVQADYESRSHNLDMEWCLRDEVFTYVCEQFGTPSIDLFASRINARVKNYVAWRPDPYALHVDAFQLSWSGLNAYAFPPFSVITQVLQKARRERPASLILIAPRWPTKPWFPLLRLLSQRQLRLPLDSIFLPQDHQCRHRLGRSLVLMAYRL